MNTLVMAVAVVKDGDKILLRKMDPDKSPYEQLWALFGGRIDDEGVIIDSLNRDLTARWNFSVTITEKLWWDEEQKLDSDGEEKRFIYLGTLCNVADGTPNPNNEKEVLEWAELKSLANYDINPPSRVLLKRLGYLD